MKVGKKILEWDDSKFEDADESSFAWDDLIYELMEILKKKSPTGNWHIEVKNFGWRNLNGEKDFHVDNARAWLCNILPDTQCKFKIHNYGRGLAIQNFHHDNPTGNEMYYCLPRKSLKGE
jgi:hypothetical protein